MPDETAQEIVDRDRVVIQQIGLAFQKRRSAGQAGQGQVGLVRRSVSAIGLQKGGGFKDGNGFGERRRLSSEERIGRWLFLLRSALRKSLLVISAD